MTDSKLSRTSLWCVVALTAFFFVIHSVGAFGLLDGDDKRLMFVCFAAVNALSIVILLVPLRAGADWAWAASWIQVVVDLLVPVVDEENLVIPYVPLAVLTAVGLLLARPQGKR